MKSSRILLAGAALCIVGAAAAAANHRFGNQEGSAAASSSSLLPIATRTPNAAQMEPSTLPAANPTDNSASSPPPASAPVLAHAPNPALLSFLDAVIEDAINRGTLHVERLSAQQLALLPKRFQPAAPQKPGELTPEEVARAEKLIALGDDAPDDPPPQLECPPPGQLPENWNNEYNKKVLRDRGCQL